MADPEAARLRLGRRGEEVAADWYRARGYRVVARNWRCRDGELDLVVSDGRVLVFCEVKARTTSAFGAPVEAVTRAKQARIRRLAARWLAEESPHPGSPRPSYGGIRFDVVAVLGGRVEVVEGAF